MGKNDVDFFFSPMCDLLLLLVRRLRFDVYEFLVMCMNVFSHMKRDTATMELKLLQFRKVANARERFQHGEGPSNLLKITSRYLGKADVGDLRAVNNKNFELWELILAEGKLAFVIRIVQEL
jgi:hypothetical protein